MRLCYNPYMRKGTPTTAKEGNSNEESNEAYCLPYVSQQITALADLKMLIQESNVSAISLHRLWVATFFFLLQLQHSFLFLLGLWREYIVKVD